MAPPEQRGANAQNKLVRQLIAFNSSTATTQNGEVAMMTFVTHRHLVTYGGRLFARIASQE